MYEWSCELVCKDIKRRNRYGFFGLILYFVAADVFNLQRNWVLMFTIIINTLFLSGFVTSVHRSRGLYFLADYKKVINNGNVLFKVNAGLNNSKKTHRERNWTSDGELVHAISNFSPNNTSLHFLKLAPTRRLCVVSNVPLREISRPCHNVFLRNCYPFSVTAAPSSCCISNKCVIACF